MNETQHAVRLGALLAAVWLVLSNRFEALPLAFGAVSCALTLYLALRMDRTDREAVPLAYRAGAWFGFVAWLGVEIVKSNLAVTRAILDPRLPIRPSTVRVRATQRTLLGRVSFANSITLTPGTVSMDLDGDAIDVHTLLAASPEAMAEMGRRVSAMERPR